MARTKRDIIKKHERSRRRRLKLRLAGGAILLFVLVGGSIWVAHRPSLLINKIELEGSKTATQAEVEKVVLKALEGNYYYFYPKRHAWLYSDTDITDAIIKKFPRFAEVSISQLNDQTLKIKVEERKPKFLWCDIGRIDCYYTDETGLAFMRSPNFSNRLFFEFIADLKSDPVGSYPLPTAEFAKILEFKKSLSSIMSGSLLDDLRFSELWSDEDNDYYFVASSTKILFNLKQDLNLAANNLKSALASKDFNSDMALGDNNLEYIDLRTNPKVFYRFRE